MAQEFFFLGCHYLFVSFLNLDRVEFQRLACLQVNEAMRAVFKFKFLFMKRIEHMK